jgi:hypothetical protein
VSPRERFRNALERTLLGFLMTGVALVMEKALDRMVAKRPGTPSPGARLGQRLLQRFVPAMQVRHQHQHGPPKA